MTGPDSACCTCEAGSGTARRSSPGSGSTTSAAPGPSMTRAVTTARTGGWPTTAGTFFCSGFELQRVLCVPSSDLVVVRLGKTPESDYDTPKRWLEEIVSAFDA